MTISEANLGEPVQARAVLDMLDAYAVDPMGDGRPLPESTRNNLIKELRDFPGALVLLAWDAGRPVGVAICFTGFSSFRARRLFNVHDLAVLPEYRGRGVGSGLLETVQDVARERGYCKVTLEVREDNERARRLYRRAGFRAGTSGGRPVQYLFLEKQLNG